jgi:hypothetical protein
MTNIEYGVITMSNKTGSEYQVDKGTAGSVYDNVMAIVPYGVLYNAPIGSHIAIIDDNENGIIGIPFNLKYQQELAEGDFLSGNLFKGSYVLHNNGKIRIANKKQNFFTLQNEILQLVIEITTLNTEIFTTLSTLTVATANPGSPSPITPSIASEITSKTNEITAKMQTLQAKQTALAELLF